MNFGLHQVILEQFKISFHQIILPQATFLLSNLQVNIRVVQTAAHLRP